LGPRLAIAIGFDVKAILETSPTLPAFRLDEDDKIGVVLSRMRLRQKAADSRLAVANNNEQILTSKPVFAKLVY